MQALLAALAEDSQQQKEASTPSKRPLLSRK
jgi:hypothetical protein